MKGKIIVDINMSSISYARAGQAEILRGAQKDDQVTDRLGDTMSDIIFALAGNRRWLKSRLWREMLGNLLYYGFTTVSGLQTLGEEYTGIIQIEERRQNIPGKFIRLCLVLLNCGGEIFLLEILKRLENSLKLSQTNLRPEAQAKLLSYISLVKVMIPYVHRLHKAIFYLSGNYYQIAKRITGIKYVLIRQWMKANISYSGFRILGFVSLLYLFVLGAQSSFNRWKLQDDSEFSKCVQVLELKTSSSGSKLRCALCLEDRKNTSVTPCGHLFCWMCILEWVQMQKICPLCREKVLPSRIVLLQNYEPEQKIRHIV